MTLIRTASPGFYHVIGEPTLFVSCWKQMGGTKGNRKQVSTWSAWIAGFELSFSPAFCFNEGCLLTEINGS